MRRVLCLLFFVFLLSPLDVSAAQPGDPALRGERLLHRLGQNLAKSLEDEQLRSRLHKLLNETPFIEGRVPLKRLLNDNAELRTLLLGETAKSWKAAAPALPELELYFPDKEHRSVWTGGPDIAVAVPIENGDRYRVYSPGGGAQEIKGGKAPATPTLLLAKSEIDYDDLDSALIGGKRTGPYLERLLQEGKAIEQAGAGCITQGGKAGGASDADKLLESLNDKAAVTTSSTYVTLFRLKNDYEGWPRGSNEIEMFGNVDGVGHDCTRITGIDEDKDYYYAIPAERVIKAAPTGTSQANVLIWEDDDDGCHTKSGDDYIGAANQVESQFGIRQYYTNFDLRLQAKANPVCGDTQCEAGESIYCCECSFCGDQFCNWSCGEDQFSCGYDCSCGDFYCDFNEDYWSCPNDCKCGNFVCDFGENSFSCPQDCS